MAASHLANAAFPAGVAFYLSFIATRVVDLHRRPPDSQDAEERECVERCGDGVYGHGFLTLGVGFLFTIAAVADASGFTLPVFGHIGPSNTVLLYATMLLLLLWMWCIHALVYNKRPEDVPKKRINFLGVFAVLVFVFVLLGLNA